VIVNGNASDVILNNNFELFPSLAYTNCHFKITVARNNTLVFPHSTVFY